MNAFPHKADVVVVGAGFAGLATARELAAAGLDVVVLEAEAIPGFHSSGRNAAIARRLIEAPAVAALADHGLSLLKALPSDVPLFAETGGLLLGKAPLLAHLARVAAGLPALGAITINAADAVARVPALAGADIDGGLFVPGDGVVDIHALLSTLLAPVRAKTFFEAPVTAIGRGSLEARPSPVGSLEARPSPVGSLEARPSPIEHGAGFVVTTPLGRIATPRIVNAAGFRANAIAAHLGLPPLPLKPVRRHLFVTTKTDLVARDAPWVWDGSTGWYFRPEGPGLLMCACDQTSWPDDQPIDPPVDPAAKDALAEKFDRAVPGLREVRPSRGWAGLRILTPDDRFVIGADPRVPGFTWVAGLGGHGMTTSCAVGELGALAARGLPLPDPYREAFDPLRF